MIKVRGRERVRYHPYRGRAGGRSLHCTALRCAALALNEGMNAFVSFRSFVRSFVD